MEERTTKEFVIILMIYIVLLWTSYWRPLGHAHVRREQTQHETMHLTEGRTRRNMKLEPRPPKTMPTRPLIGPKSDMDVVRGSTCATQSPVPWSLSPQEKSVTEASNGCLCVQRLCFDVHRRLGKGYLDDGKMVENLKKPKF